MRGEQIRVGMLYRASVSAHKYAVSCTRAESNGFGCYSLSVKQIHACVLVDALRILMPLSQPYLAPGYAALRSQQKHHVTPLPPMLWCDKHVCSPAYPQECIFCYWQSNSSHLRAS